MGNYTYFGDGLNVGNMQNRKASLNLTQNAGSPGKQPMNINKYKKGHYILSNKVQPNISGQNTHNSASKSIKSREYNSNNYHVWNPKAQEPNLKIISEPTSIVFIKQVESEDDTMPVEFKNRNYTHEPEEEQMNSEFSIDK